MGKDLVNARRKPIISTAPGITISERTKLIQELKMALAKEKKEELVGKFKRAEQDTGSPEVQVALDRLSL